MNNPCAIYGGSIRALIMRIAFPRQMPLSLLFGLVLCLPSQASADDFPYDGVITENEAYVRSGNKRSFYPTDRLSRGDRVVVVRQDPGGWLMIKPPPGSFSWIPTRYVRRVNSRRGRVTDNNVIVRVGSKFDDIHDAFQRRLSEGDEVQILGSKMLRMDERFVEMYKIMPPRGEHRWIRSHLVMPAESNGSIIVENSNMRETEFATEKVGEETESNGEQVFASSSKIKGPSSGVRRTGPAREEIVIDRQRLDELDRELDRMLKRPKQEWDFEKVELSYEELAETTVHPAISNHVEFRLQSIARYKRSAESYQSQLAEVLRITKQAEERDRQLRDKGRTTTRSRPISKAPRFDGAGIIGKTTDRSGRLPRHVLMAPNGRVLSYLVAGNKIDLDLYIGRAMGLRGERKFDARLGRDLLQVRELTPVRLKK